MMDVAKKAGVVGAGYSKMEASLIEKKENVVSFVIKGINSVIANTIRRSILTNVPTMAIDEVNFLKNDSALYDEMISHRLGLVPLRTDLKSYNLLEECTCKGQGCPKCQLNLTLKAKGPCTVYSENLVSADPEVKPTFDKIPITVLTDGQKLEIEAVARLGVGRTHAKHIPGVVYYKAYPDPEYLDETKESSKTDFMFVIESFGQISPKEMLEEGIKRFERKIDDLEKALKKIK